MRRIFTTISQKWPEYLLEILVITFGILGAFALNNWNELRKEKQQESYLMKMLYKEIQQDSLDLAGDQRLLKSHINRTTYLLNQLDNPTPDLEKVISNIFFAGRFLWFESHMPTYDEMVSSGQLGILKNDSLKQLLSRYDGLKYTYETFLLYESQQTKAAYNRHKNKYFDLSIMAEYWESGGQAPQDSILQYFNNWDGFRKDPETPMHLRNTRGVNSELLTIYQKAHGRIINNLLAFLRQKIAPETD